MSNLIGVIRAKIVLFCIQSKFVSHSRGEDLALMHQNVESCTKPPIVNIGSGVIVDLRKAYVEMEIMIRISWALKSAQKGVVYPQVGKGRESQVVGPIPIMDILPSKVKVIYGKSRKQCIGKLPSKKRISSHSN